MAALQEMAAENMGMDGMDDMEMDHDDMSGDMDSEMSGDTEGDG